MASSIFAILDDIAILMDDVAVASKIATKKTAGILGDDLAVNAEKATGFLSTRELPVLWAITKGAFVNKIIIIPVIFGLNILLPIAIKIILIIGGFYLAYEGVEKIVHYFFSKGHGENRKSTSKEIETESLETEKKKVKNAISTDFILSLEIVIIALSTVLNKPLEIQIVTVLIVALLATVGVYGIVALIVRMDDAGFKLIRMSKKEGFLRKLGRLLVRSLPFVIRALSVIGTIALILVSGGIFIHNIEFLHAIFPIVPSVIKEIIAGLVAGTLTFFVVTLGLRIGRVVKQKK